MNKILDEKDYAIIDELKNNSKLSEQKIARKTNIPMTTVHNRISKLRAAGIIEKYTIKLNYSKMGKHINAFVLVKAIHADQKELLEYIAKLPNVHEAAMITGEFDILFKVRVATMEELNDLVVQNLRKQKRVGETRTMVCYNLIEKI